MWFLRQLSGACSTRRGCSGRCAAVDLKRLPAADGFAIHPHPASASKLHGHEKAGGALQRDTIAIPYEIAGSIAIDKSKRFPRSRRKARGQQSASATLVGLE